MNNEQFRRLVQDTPSAVRQDGTQVSARGGKTPALGSRIRSNIPMTPRTVAGSSGNDFARQLAERNAELNGTAAKKFRSSAAPKGARLGSGYQDRTQMRMSEEEDEKAVRVKALEEQMKLGQLAPETFEALRNQIIGNDVKDVHLVKGLDYRLLERVRRGEDVLSGAVKAKELEKESEKEEPEAEADVDEELEKLEGKDIQPLAKEVQAKKGEMAPPAPAAGKKRTRDDILKELRASRFAAAEKAKARQPQLGPRFSKVGARKETSRIEKDAKGQEILITTDADGNIKRKVKKARTEDDFGNGLLMPDKDVAPLGMDVTTLAPPLASVEDEDGDIFDEVGKDYNPLADLVYDDDGEDSDDSDAEAKAPPDRKDADSQPASAPAEIEVGSIAPPPGASPAKRNYFNDTPLEDSRSTNSAPNPLQDPTILAALKKASTINPLTTADSSPAVDEETAKLARRKKMLESHDRDADDMDLEFGSSRFGDQEDGEEGGKIKLSVWEGEGDGGGDGKEGGKGKRKRAPKKRKGDVNSAADVLRVMEAKKGKS